MTQRIVRYSEIKPAISCRFDAVALGEVMLRFDPFDIPTARARSIRVFQGGGKINVACGLASRSPTEPGTEIFSHLVFWQPYFRARILRPPYNGVQPMAPWFKKHPVTLRWSIRKQFSPKSPAVALQAA